MSKTLSGRTALVTGGDSGIGAACAVALAKVGADVSVVYHSDEKGAAATARAVEKRGQRAVAVQADVGDEDSLNSAFDESIRQLGAPDVLVCSAGLNMTGVDVVDMPLEQWQRVVRTDLTGTFLAARRFVREVGDGPAAVIVITSIHAQAVREGGADYGAAKGGQRNLVRTLAIEVAGRGITVNAIAPGMILTPMNKQAVEDADVRREAERHIPVGRAGQPEEIGRVAVFLADPASAYITGTTVTVDGGLSLMQALGA